MGKATEMVIAAVASFCVVIIIFTCIFSACRSRSRRRKDRPPLPVNRTRQLRQAGSRADLSSISVDESTTFDPSLRISMALLVEATGQFSPDLIIGDGGFGMVYKAQLPNGITVAIKKLSPDAFQGFREFRAEMETLGKLQHPNIVKILGYCVSNTDRVLVYEFIEKGSLDLWLHDTSAADDGGSPVWPRRLFEKFAPLPWATRMKIIRDVASGLDYLHGLPKPIIHRDIKAGNVLLDRDFNAHIADFGLARVIDDASHTHVSTQVAGTMGYMPPEYKEGLTLASVKADVYSFGILMFEVGTGQQPNLPVTVHEETRPKEVALIDWARRLMLSGKEIDMVDAKISRESLDEAKVKEYFKIAATCTNDVSKKRPSMSEVLNMLNRLSST